MKFDKENKKNNIFINILKKNNDKKDGNYKINSPINNNIQIHIKKNFGKNKKKFKSILIFLCFMIINIFSYLKNKQILIPFFKQTTLLNIYIATHKDFVNVLSSPVYKILCDEKSKLKKAYNLPIIETNKDNILFQKKEDMANAQKSILYGNYIKKEF